MNVRLVRTFLAIVDEGGVNRAAAALHVAQPSVSQALRQLEGELKTRLFERVGGRLRLTDFGEEYVTAARRIADAVDAAQDLAERARNLEVGRVRLTALPSLNVDPVPALCSRFHNRYPHITVIAEQAFTAAECYQAVRSGNVDLAVTVADRDVAGDGITHEHVGAIELLLISPPGTRQHDHPLRPDALHDFQFIAGRPGTWTRQVLDEFRSNYHHLDIAADVASRDMVVPLVVSGVGSALVTPQYARSAALDGVVIHRLNPPPRRPIACAYRTNNSSRAVDAFIGLIRDADLDFTRAAW